MLSSVPGIQAQIWEKRPRQGGQGPGPGRLGKGQGAIPKGSQWLIQGSGSLLPGHLTHTERSWGLIWFLRAQVYWEGSGPIDTVREDRGRHRGEGAGQGRCPNPGSYPGPRESLDS